MRKLYYSLHKTIAWSLCAFALAAVGCNDDDDPQEQQKVVDHGALVEDGTPVEATLSLKVDDARSSIHTYSSASRAAGSVTNLWILEYDAAGKCLASEKIESYTSGKEIKVNLIAGKNVDLYAIANAGDMSFDKMTLSDLQAATWGGVADKLEDLPFAGSAKADITYANFQSNDLVLERIGSQVKIHYIVDSESPFEVKSFQLRNVPKTFRFISGAAVTADDVEDKQIVAENLEEVYTYIIPENLQGVDETILNAKDKKTDKPATYVEVKGYYEDPSIATAFDASYKMYLGENNTNDFNLCRNRLYQFVGNLRLEDSDDNRVATTEIPTPYTQPESNCYMLTPDAEHGLAVPVSRVNTFWKAVNSRKELNDGANDSPIQKWVVKVLWQDVSGEIIKFGKAEGVKSDEFFEVLPAGNGTEGNVVVGIYDATAGTDIDVASATPLWSWHIWVTTYNPGDQNWVAMPAYSKEGMITGSDPNMSSWSTRAAYAVPGGKIYQHNGCVQNTSANATVDYAIMDRNLGALSSDKAQFDKTVGFYYQWGRKDPFYAPAGDATAIDYSVEEAQEIFFTVENPTKFITAYGNWTTQNNDKLWREGSSYSPEKSIYDPCPAGWMVAPKDVYKPLTIGDGYTMSGTYKPYVSRSEAIPGSTADDLSNAYAEGYLFWPNDLGVWFPAAGYINGKIVQEYKNQGKWWCNAMNSSKGIAYRMQQYPAGEDDYGDNPYYHFWMCVDEGIGSNSAMNVAMPVRCVMEKK